MRADSGQEVRLRRPLDFLVVADHAENLGVLPSLMAGDEAIPDTDDGSALVGGPCRSGADPGHVLGADSVECLRPLVRQPWRRRRARSRG